MVTAVSSPSNVLSEEPPLIALIFFFSGSEPPLTRFLGAIQPKSASGARATTLLHRDSRKALVQKMLLELGQKQQE